jgi:hypothetical protein
VRSPLRTPVLITAFSILMAAIVAVTIYLVIRPQSGTDAGPLRLVGSVSVNRSPGGTVGCNGAVSFVATGSVSGSGTLTYQWERSDGVKPVLRQIPVSAGQSAFQTDPVVWSFSGTQQSSGTMTFHLLKPTDIKISVAVTDSCR